MFSDRAGNVGGQTGYQSGGYGEVGNQSVISAPLNTSESTPLIDWQRGGTTSKTVKIGLRSVASCTLVIGTILAAIALVARFITDDPDFLILGGITGIIAGCFCLLSAVFSATSLCV